MAQPETSAPSEAQIQLQDFRNALKSLGNTQADEEEHIEILCTMGAIYSHISLDSSRICIADGLRLSKKIGYKMGQARASMLMANIDGRTGKNIKAIEEYQEALRLYTEAKSMRGIVACYTNIGTIYQSEGKYQEAEEYFQKTVSALDTTRTAGKNMELGVALFNLGELYAGNLNEPAKGLPYMQRAIVIIDEVNNSPARVAFYLGLGGCLTQLNKPTEGLGYYLKALQLARESGNQSGIASSYTHIADVYVIRKDVPKALSYLAEAETVFETIEDKVELLNVYEKQYEINLLENDHPAALEALKKELVLVRRMENKTTTVALYQHLEAEYTALGDTGKAKKYKDLAEALLKEQ